MRVSRLLLLLLALACSDTAFALRCEGRVVSPGDHAFQVRERCGQPFWTERYVEVLIAGERGPLERRVEREIEAWYYNFGPNQLMRRLSFVDRRLVREDSLGYGYRRLGEHCDLDALLPGMSDGEIVARCGEPASRERRYADRTVRDEFGNARLRVIRHEEWIYVPEGARAARLLTLSDGSLIQVERLRR
jgi:hypothetical protein